MADGRVGKRMSRFTKQGTGKHNSWVVSDLDTGGGWEAKTEHRLIRAPSSHMPVNSPSGTESKSLGQEPNI